MCRYRHATAEVSNYKFAVFIIFAKFFCYSDSSLFLIEGMCMA